MHKSKKYVSGYKLNIIARRMVMKRLPSSARCGQMIHYQGKIVYVLACNVLNNLDIDVHNYGWELRGVKCDYYICLGLGSDQVIEAAYLIESKHRCLFPRGIKKYVKKPHVFAEYFKKPKDIDALDLYLRCGCLVRLGIANKIMLEDLASVLRGK